MQDTAEVSILRLELENDKVEWVAFNPLGKELALAKSKVTKKLAYLVE